LQDGEHLEDCEITIRASPFGLTWGQAPSGRQRHLKSAVRYWEGLRPMGLTISAAWVESTGGSKIRGGAIEPGGVNGERLMSKRAWR